MVLPMSMNVRGSMTGSLSDDVGGGLDVRIQDVDMFLDNVFDT